MRSVHAPTFTLAAAVAATTACSALADETTFTADLDRWNYPFNSTPGIRSLAPTFGAFGTTAFDEQDGQFLVGFDVSALPAVPADISKVTVTATHSTGSFLYDDTYDTMPTYFVGSAVTDADPGRPVMLTGAGLRGGFTEFGFGPTVTTDTVFQEGEAFGDNVPFPFPGVPNREDRNAFAAAFDDNGNLIDVSNHVSNLFDFTPFGIGTVDGLSPGDPVIEAVAGTSPGSTFTFEVDLSDPFIRQYIEQGVADGGLFFSITSLHTTGQTGGTNPNFYTGDNFDPAAIAPTLTIEYAVPEPSAAVVVMLAAAGVLTRRRRPAAG